MIQDVPNQLTDIINTNPSLLRRFATVTYHHRRNYIPLQILPSAVYPLGQRQTWDPSVLKHRALESQTSFSHSLTSVLKKSVGSNFHAKLLLLTRKIL